MTYSKKWIYVNMASNHCVNIPDAPNGEMSKLFVELQSRIKDRDLVKKIWAFTKTKLFQNEFTDLPVDENGEYTFDSINEALGLESIMNDYGKDNDLAISIGVTTKSGSPVVFRSTSEAMSAAERYNKQAKKTVAVVTEDKDGRPITEVRDNTPQNIAAADQNKYRAALNKVLIDLMNKLGMDVKFMDNPDYEAIFDPKNAERNAWLLKEVIRVANGEKGFESLPEEVSHLILAGLSGHQLKARIDAAFTPEVVRQVLGDEYSQYYRQYRNGETPLGERLRDEAEGKILADVLKKRSTSLVEGVPRNLFQRVLNWFINLFKGRRTEDIDNLIANARNSLQNIAQMTIDGTIIPILDKESIMNHEALFDLNQETDQFRIIAEEGEVILSQRLYLLQTSHSEQDTKALRQVIKDTRNDIEKQHYYSACYRIMSMIGKEIQDVMIESQRLGFIHNGTTDLNLISYEADLVKRMQVILEGYVPYLNELSMMTSLQKKGEVNLDYDTAKEIEDRADEYLKRVKGLSKDAKSLRYEVIKQLISLYYGLNGERPETFTENENIKWESVDSLLHYAKDDISLWDTTIFSAGDSRSPLINVVHNIIKSQQASRDNKIGKLTAMMQEADAKLRAAGHDNKFVYQFDENGNPTGYYVGPIDMMRFEKERADYWKMISEIDGIDYYEEQRLKLEWEENHMEDVEVGEPDETGYRRKERLPKRSLYSNDSYDEGWTQAQKDYYKKLIDMKAEMDSVLPPSMRNLYAAPQVRKSVSQMFDKDGRGAIATILGQWKSKYTITDDNMDYNNSTTKEVALGFDNEPIKRVPVYFIHKLKDIRDLSTDATHAMFCYIAMAANYSEMGQLADAMSLLQDYVRDTDDPTGGFSVQQTDANKPIMGYFKALGRKYRQKYTKSGAETRIAKELITLIDRTVFNETKERIGNVNNPFAIAANAVRRKLGKPEKEEKPISIDNLLSALLRLTSVSRMGLNVLSGMTNVTQGETQMIEEATRGVWFNIKDYGWAQKEYGRLLFDYMGNFNSADRHDKMYMLINQFNSSEDYFRDMRDKDFNDSAFKRVLGRGNIMFLNTMGEHKLHTTGMLSVLKHEQVKVLSGEKKGQEMSLYDAITQVHDDNGWHLELIGDLEFKDKKKPFLISHKYGEIGKVTTAERDVLFEKLNLYINNINAGMHGGYSEIEKGNWNRTALFQFINQFRQWMWGMYNKLYSGDYYDAVMMVQREGSYRSFMKFFTGTLYDLKNMSLKEAIEHNRLTKEDMLNARVAWSQSAIFLMLSLMCMMTMGWKDDDDRSSRILAYNLLRLRTETGALVPWPSSFFHNVFTLVQSPAAAINSLETLTTLLDMNSYWNEVSSGRFKGWPKVIKAAYTMTPVYNVGKLIDMKDYNYMFNIFN